MASAASAITFTGLSACLPSHHPPSAQAAMTKGSATRWPTTSSVHEVGDFRSRPGDIQGHAVLLKYTHAHRNIADAGIVGAAPCRQSDVLRHVWRMIERGPVFTPHQDETILVRRRKYLFDVGRLCPRHLPAVRFELLEEMARRLMNLFVEIPALGPENEDIRGQRTGDQGHGDDERRPKSQLRAEGKPFPWLLGLQDVADAAYTSGAASPQTGRRSFRRSRWM